MRYNYTHIDVNDPIGPVSPGTIVILSGEAQRWKYCYLLQKCIMEGAAVVAIGHGYNMTEDADCSVVAYSVLPNFQIGKPISATTRSLSPGAKKLLLIIKHPNNGPAFSQEDRREFAKNEYLKPENADVFEQAVDLMLELVYAGYLAKCDEPESIITDEEYQQFWQTISFLGQTRENR